LRANDCPLSKAYDLSKIHKLNSQLRIIVSSIGTTLYLIVTYLHNLIKKHPTRHWLCQ